MKNLRSLLLMLLLLVLVSIPVSAEDGNPAILARGPVPHTGIEFLGVNAISSQYGEYVYEGRKIVVYYTTEEIFLSDKWSDSDCGVPEIRQLRQESGRIVMAYSDKRGWTAFFAFDSGVSWACRFIEVYSSRQNYFLNISRNKNEFSFPAVLEL